MKHFKSKYSDALETKLVERELEIIELNRTISQQSAAAEDEWKKATKKHYRMTTAESRIIVLDAENEDLRAKIKDLNEEIKTLIVGFQQRHIIK